MLMPVDVVDAVGAFVVVFYFYCTVCFVRCAVCGRFAFLSKMKKKARVIRKLSSTAGAGTAAVSSAAAEADATAAAAATNAADDDADDDDDDYDDDST